ncbi:hypothetical protein AGMMS49938_12750 [Fibrobacterales bacterium]|nr:hypothetical protein AGMMS49938_12750 [Fibrobacterales bacterium]
MLKRTLKVINSLGIHARPAGRIVDITSSAKSDVELTYHEQTVNAKSILNLMMLAMEKDSEIEFVADGEDEQQVLDELEKLFQDKFYEDAS